MPVNVFGSRVFLFDKRLIVKGIRCGIPSLLEPRMVGPTNTERKIGPFEPDNLFQGHIKHLYPTAEPVVIVTECGDSCFFCQFGLLFPNLRQTEIVISQICRDLGLIMSPEQRSRLSDVCPLCKSGAIPLVIFRSRVILRKIKGYDLYFVCAHLL